MEEKGHTFPSVEKCFSSSLLVIRGDKPVTYKLLPGFSASLDGLLYQKITNWTSTHDKTFEVKKDEETEFKTSTQRETTLTGF